MIQQKTEKNVIGALHLVFVFAYQLNYKYPWCAAPFLVIVIFRLPIFRSMYRSINGIFFAAALQKNLTESKTKVHPCTRLMQVGNYFSGLNFSASSHHRDEAEKRAKHSSEKLKGNGYYLIFPRTSTRCFQNLPVVSMSNRSSGEWAPADGRAKGNHVEVRVFFKEQATFESGMDRTHNGVCGK